MRNLYSEAMLAGLSLAVIAGGAILLECLVGPQPKLPKDEDKTCKEGGDK